MEFPIISVWYETLRKNRSILGMVTAYNLVTQIVTTETRITSLSNSRRSSHSFTTSHFVAAQKQRYVAMTK